MMHTKPAVTQKNTLLDDGQTWYDLYTWLLPVVEMWVRDAGVASWRGQQHEVAEDIAHEAVTRTFSYEQRASRGEMPPIGSLRALARVIALNYLRDCRKKDRCLIRPEQESEAGSIIMMLLYSSEDAAQIALDRLLLDSIIVAVARAVATFPRAQKAALLTDLANITAETAGEDQCSPTRLEQALSEQGLCLKNYRRTHFDTPTERTRYASLRSIAYKRLKQAMQV